MALSPTRILSIFVDKSTAAETSVDDALAVSIGMKMGPLSFRLYTAMTAIRRDLPHLSYLAETYLGRHFIS